MFRRNAVVLYRNVCVQHSGKGEQPIRRRVTDHRVLHALSVAMV